MYALITSGLSVPCSFSISSIALSNLVDAKAYFFCLAYNLKIYFNKYVRKLYKYNIAVLSKTILSVINQLKRIENEKAQY